jgi:hypothetical protein
VKKPTGDCFRVGRRKGSLIFYCETKLVCEREECVVCRPRKNTLNGMVYKGDWNMRGARTGLEEEVS